MSMLGMIMLGAFAYMDHGVDIPNLEKKDERGDEKMYKLAVIHWKINGKTGHGLAIDTGVAVEFARLMNEKYGSGTHWVLFVTSDNV